MAFQDADVMKATVMTIANYKATNRAEVVNAVNFHVSLSAHEELTRARTRMHDLTKALQECSERCNAATLETTRAEKQRDKALVRTVKFIDMIR